MTVRFRVLGTLRIESHGEVTPVPSGRVHTTLAALLLHGDEGLTEDALRELVSEDGEPLGGESTVRSYVARVRGLLRRVDPQLDIERRPQGWVLVAEGATVDRDEFERLLARARQASGAGDPATAAEAAGSALALWRGPAYGPAGDLPAFVPEARRLNDERWAALEVRAAALLELGREDEVTGELLAAVDR
ncbi:MAG TPA: BTAD domain-containing putative transcriptional regulator, partial [Acidimicrobiales bacterium]|nr:BTAD domain-containing putative transcriptional regulator [Acidimicrobiales bacterium]